MMPQNTRPDEIVFLDTEVAPDTHKVLDIGAIRTPLLFPRRPYHKLLKDDKIQTEELNNPLNDAKKPWNYFGTKYPHFISYTRL